MADQDKPTDENFLDRWSRLKAHRQVEPRRRRGGGAAPRPGETVAPEPAVTPEATEPVPVPAVAADLSDPPEAEALADGVAVAEEAAAIEDLPDVDSLDADSDYTGFLKPGVPELLRRKALRALWRSDPVLANLDGLNDYDEDFSAIGMVTQRVSSLYKVGEGMLDAEPAPEEDAARDEDTAHAPTPDAPESETTEPAAVAADDPHRQASDDSETGDDPESDNG